METPTFGTAAKPEPPAPTAGAVPPAVITVTLDLVRDRLCLVLGLDTVLENAGQMDRDPAAPILWAVEDLAGFVSWLQTEGPDLFTRLILDAKQLTLFPGAALIEQPERILDALRALGEDCGRTLKCDQGSADPYEFGFVTLAARERLLRNDAADCPDDSLRREAVALRTIRNLLEGRTFELHADLAEAAQA